MNVRRLHDVAHSVANLVAWLVLVTLAQASDASAYKRWAILTSNDSEASATAELLTATLAQDANLALVDRGHLAEIAREWEIGALFEGPATDKRIKLGKLVGADALVLMRRVDDANAGRTELGLVICDAHCGARLFTDRYSIAPADLPVSVTQIGRAVHELRERFPDGIRRMIVVPAFLSRDLDQLNDWWQLRFMALLDNALCAYPGTAVLEMEEAAAIQREQALTVGSSEKSLVPLIVEGEYRSAGPEPLKRKIQLKLKLKSTGSEPGELAKEAEGFAVAASWLHDEAAAAIIRQLEQQAVAALPVAQQIEALNARAKSFSRLGSYALAAATRDAALMVAPDDAEQAMSMLDDICAALQVKPARQWRYRIYVSATEQEATTEWCIRLALWERGLEVLTTFIQRGLLTQTEALGSHRDLVVALCEFRDLTPHLGASEEELFTEAARRIMEPGLEKCTALDRTFRAEIIPIIPTLKADDRRPPHNRSNPNGFYQMSVSRPSQTMDGCLNAMLELPNYRQREFIVPEFTREKLLHYGDVLTSARAVKVTAAPALGLANSLLCNPDFKRTFSDEGFAEFLGRMRRSCAAFDEFCARFGQIALERLHSGTLDATKSLAALQALERDFQKSSAYSDKSELQKQLRQTIGALALKREESLSQPAPASLPARASSDTPVQAATAASAPVLGADVKQIAIHPLNMKVRYPDGRIASLRPRRWAEEPGAQEEIGPLTGVRWAGPKSEVFCSNSTVLLHREAGILDVIFQDDEAAISDLAFDGANLWVATLNRGMLVFSPEGRLITKLDHQHGLPPSSTSLRVIDIEPNRVLAAGTFGDQHRSWIGTLSLQGDQIAVDVFHEATKVYAQNEPISPGEAVFEAYTTCCLQRWWDPLGDGGTQFLVNRVKASGFPLLVDVDNRTISVLNLQLGRAKPDVLLGHFNFRRNGDAVYGRGDDIYLVPALGCLTSNGELLQVLSESSKSGFGRETVVWGGAKYFFGYRCARVNYESMQPEDLGPDPLFDALQTRDVTHFESQLFGPIAWTAGGRFFQLDLPRRADLQALAGEPWIVTVVDESSGAALEGARVSVLRTTTTAEYLTGADGKCTIDLEPGLDGTVQVAAHKSGWRAVVRTISAPDDIDLSQRALQIALAPGVKIGGALKDAHGTPLCGAEIHFGIVQGGNSLPRDFAGPTFSDTAGQWQKTLGPMKLSNLALSVELPGRRKNKRLENLSVATIDELQRQTHEWTITDLGPHMRRVVDADEHPIAGAKIEFGLFRKSPGAVTPPDTSTNERGEFNFEANPTGINDFVVRMPGYAPSVQAFNNRENDIKLVRGNPVHGRVVDQDDQPLEDVEVTYQGQGTMERITLWSATTGPSGEFDWANAPSNDISAFSARREGYLLNPVTLGPTAEVVLHMSRVVEADVEGLVTSAETGEPLRIFQVVPVQGNQRDQAITESFLRNAMFVDGHYRLHVRGQREPALQFSGFGFLPQIVAVPKSRDSGIVLNVSLSPGSDSRVRLLGVDGQPCLSTEVYWCLEGGQGSQSVNDGVLRQTPKVGAATDTNGVFSIPVQAHPYFIFAANDQGYAELRLEPSASPSMLQMARWSRIEGKCSLGLAGGATQQIRLENPPFQRGKQGISKSYHTRSDESGRFVIEKVPPGQYVLARTVRRSSKSQESAGNEQRVNRRVVAVEPGNTTVADLAPENWRVVGRLISSENQNSAPENLDLSGQWSEIFADTRPDNWPRLSLEEKKAWRAEHLDLLEKQAKAPTNAQIEIAADGRFMVENLGPGDYRLHFSIRPQGNRSPTNLTTFDFHLDAVPEAGPSSLDLGPIELGTTAIKITTHDLRHFPEP